MKALMLLVSLVWLPFVDMPQNKFQFSNNCKITIAGTSSLHDWTMESKVVNGEADIQVAQDEILSIKKLKVEIPVESLKSGKAVMDKNAYEALKSDSNPTISFQVKNFEKIDINNGMAAMEVSGNLTVAGKTKSEHILVNYKTDANGNLRVRGSKRIKMTDYGVTPPEVMMGTVKTDDEITISFDLNLVQNSQL